MKKSLKIMLLAALAATLTGCATGKAPEKTQETTAAATAKSEAGTYTIGVAQFAEHGSLDNCREGFLQGLAAEGIEEGKNLTVLYENAQADGGTASQIVNNFLA